MENQHNVLELIKKEIIEVEESIIYHKNKLIILELKLEDLYNREVYLTNYLNLKK